MADKDEPRVRAADTRLWRQRRRGRRAGNGQWHRAGARRRHAPRGERRAAPDGRRPGGRTDHESGRRRGRRPELAEGEPARPRAARGLRAAREDHRTSTTSASPSASSTPAATGAHGYLRAHRARWPTSPPPGSSREVGEQTPVFMRFSTVAGGAGSVDTPRDVRGFAVKFYTRRATGTSSATTSRCSSSRTRSSSPTSSTP